MTIQIDGNHYCHTDELGNQIHGSRVCAHQGGLMRPDGERLRCPVHGWVKDAATGEYTNGHRDRTFGRPWKALAPNMPTGFEGPFTLRMIAHACVEITIGKNTLLTDPWLVGTAFNGGWLLTDSAWVCETPAAVWYSHAHSDHAHGHSTRAGMMREIEGLQAFAGGNVSPDVAKAIAFPVAGRSPNEWFTLEAFPGASFMILVDGTSESDTGLLIEYGGKRVLLIVDCPNLNGGILPKADLVLMAYAGGASGYPVCWEMDPAKRDALMRASNAQMLQRLLWAREQTGGRVIPYAGSFTEADPAIRAVNRHNTRAEAWAHLGETGPEPIPGTTFDVMTGEQRPPETETPTKEEWQQWQRHFQGDTFTDATLEVIDTDGSRHALDFRRPGEQATPAVAYAMRMTTPGVLGRVVRNLQPLDEISIGFHARFSRTPDVYDRAFWERYGKGVGG